MQLQGVLNYNPVTEATGAKRTATIRKYSNLLAALICCCRPHLQGKMLRHANAVAANLADPHYYYVGKSRAPDERDIEFIWELANNIANSNIDQREIHYLKHLLGEIGNKLILNDGSDNWAILRVGGEEVQNKLRDLRKEGINIGASLWGPHVSIVRGERVNNAWGKYEGHSFAVEVNLEHTRVNKQGYYWFDCTSRELERVRLELGLPPRPRTPFHLTIGKAQ